MRELSLEILPVLTLQTFKELTCQRTADVFFEALETNPQKLYRKEA
jgi:hypothetical protein